MTLSDLFRSVPFVDVWSVLTSSYDDVCVEHRRGYEDAFDELAATDPEDADGAVIVLSPCLSGPPTAPDVYGRHLGEEDEHAIDLVAWATVLGYELGECPPTAETAAHVLWEITHYGYNADTVELSRVRTREAMDDWAVTLADAERVVANDRHELDWDEVWDSMFADDDEGDLYPVNGEDWLD
jgi:hypothetical protein